MPIHRITMTGVLALGLNACASLQATDCESGEEKAIQDRLYFGTGIPDGGTVTPEDWAEFLAVTVTPKFPMGLTVSQVAGQWRGDDGAIVQESSYVLELVHPDDFANEQSVTEILSAYKTQFRQEAVLRVRDRTCVSF